MRSAAPSSRVAAAVQERLVIVVQVAEAVLQLDDSGGRVF
jgi:hypothetical protein